MVERRELCFLDPDWICVASFSRRVPYLEWDCEQVCPAVQNSLQQFRWINPFQSIAVLWAAVKLFITSLTGEDQRDGAGERREGRSGVWETVCVKGNLFFPSQANHFETRGIMLQSRSYPTKSSVELNHFSWRGWPCWLFEVPQGKKLFKCFYHHNWSYGIPVQFLLGFHNVYGSCCVRSSLALFCAFLNPPLQAVTRGSILTAAPSGCLYLSIDWSQKTKACVSAELDPGTSRFVVSRSWRAAGSWALASIFQATLNVYKEEADQLNN